MNPKPDWRVFLDYFERKARGENPKHVYDGYKGDTATSSPQGFFISNNQAVAERARAEIRSEGREVSMEYKDEPDMKQVNTKSKFPNRSQPPGVLWTQRVWTQRE